VVIEAFACELPETYIKAMARQQPKPVWINLEYLSAEGWVAGCHGGASPHPSLPLTKYFFFPGFTSDTGGLIREAALEKHFDAAAFWQKCGLPPRLDSELRISLFGYENAAVKSLLEAWAQSEEPVTCLVPEDRLLPQIASWLGRDVLRPGDAVQRGSLGVRILPFLEQDDYDRLLWASDINFVRGEDSLVRAQWAARPFVWHIYPQQEGAHWPKLEAFLDLYCADLPSQAVAGLRAFWQEWNRGGDAGKAWPDFWRHRAVLEQHARDWAASMARQDDLASNLVNFCTSCFKNVASAASLGAPGAQKPECT
jgi:uncharacterized repeat protein (TIGR03837 family)